MSLGEIRQIIDRMEKGNNETRLTRNSLFSMRLKINAILRELPKSSPNWIRKRLENIQEDIADFMKEDI